VALGLRYRAWCGCERRPPVLPRVDTAAALRLAGRRGDIHPHDAIAFIYPDRAYFEESAGRDREIHGNEVIGPMMTECGLIAVVSIVPQMRREGYPATDPALPDNWEPARKKRAS
jgi:hypothetical protein